MSELETVDRWIESLQILAGDADNPTEEQRAEMAATRRKMLDAYAHGLAEKIRNTPGLNDPDDYGGFVDQGADWAADLIDPSAGPVRPDEEPTP